MTVVRGRSDRNGEAFGVRLSFLALLVGSASNHILLGASAPSKAAEVTAQSKALARVMEALETAKTFAHMITESDAPLEILNSQSSIFNLQLQV